MRSVGEIGFHFLRQGGVGDLPPLQLAPIKDRLGKFADRNGSTGNGGAIQNALRKGSDLLAVGNVVESESAGGAPPDKALYIDHDRPVRNLGDGSKRILRRISRARIIDEK